MRKILHCYIAILLVFLCGSGMAFSETESLLHEWGGMLLIICILLHLVVNRKWFKSLLKGRYNIRRGIVVFTDAALIVIVILIAASSPVISEYIFSSLNLMGSAWGRKIHLVGTAWLLLLSGVHYGMHLAAGKRNIALYVAGVLGIAAFVILRFHERLFLISEFAYAPDIPWWCIYLMHGLMFVAFMATGVLIKRLSGKIRNTGGMKEWA